MVVVVICYVLLEVWVSSGDEPSPRVTSLAERGRDNQEGERITTGGGESQSEV
jgi:hypothetical protein